VVNIVTVSDAEGGSAHVGGGSFKTHSASASQRLEGDDWHASITAMTRRTDGPRHTVEQDSLFTQPLARKTPGEADTRNHFDSVILQAKYKETQIDASFMSSLQGNQFGHFEWISGNEEYQDELRSEALQITQGLGRHGGGELKVFAGIQRHHFDRRIQAVPEGFFHPKAPTHNGLSILAGGIPLPFPQDFFLDLESTVQRSNGRIQWVSDFSDTHRILAEASIQHIDVPRTRDTSNFDIDTFESYSVFVPNPRFPFYSKPQSSERSSFNTWSLFGAEKESYSVVLQDEITVSDSTRFTAGVRWDDFEGGDDIYSPRLALAHQLSANKLVKLQWASAFRPPSLHQEVSSFNTVDYEKMDTIDVQFSHTHSGWAFDHVAYVSWVKHKIIPSWAFDGDLLTDRPIYANSHEQYRYYGFENTVRFQASEALIFESNIAYGRGDGPRLQRSEFFVSPVTFDFSVTWDMTQSIQWFLEHRYWGPTKRRPDDSRSGLGSQFMTNLSLNISPLSDDRLTVIVAVENIFDENVKSASGWGFPTSFPNDLPQSPRRINVSAEYRW
jgi:iron complex outermembrane receptor protein